MTLRALLKEKGIPESTYRSRIRRHGWSPERALNTPIIPPRAERMARRNRVQFRGEAMTWQEVSERSGVKLRTLRVRVSRGMSLEEAASAPLLRGGRRTNRQKDTALTSQSLEIEIVIEHDVPWHAQNDSPFSGAMTAYGRKMFKRRH